MSKDPRWPYLLIPIIVFLLTGFVPAAPGAYWPLYVFGALTCFVPIIFSGKLVKIIGSALFIIFVVLIITDIQQGKKWTRHMLELQEKWQNSH